MSVLIFWDRLVTRREKEWLLVYCTSGCILRGLHLPQEESLVRAEVLPGTCWCSISCMVFLMVYFNIFRGWMCIKHKVSKEMSTGVFKTCMLPTGMWEGFKIKGEHGDIFITNYTQGTCLLKNLCMTSAYKVISFSLEFPYLFFLTVMLFFKYHW